MPRPVAVTLLVLTTMMWGFAFVAQKSAMASMGVLTFCALRYALGTIAILPLVAWELRRPDRRPISPRNWALTALVAVAFFLGVWLQQAGLTMTTVTNGGFLTSLYVLFVPLIMVLVTLHRPHPVVWLCVPMALVGVWFLNGGGIDSFNFGDLLVIGSAVCWAVQVLLIGSLSRDTGLPVTLSVICFAATAAFSTIGAFATETPDLAAAQSAWVEILYAGILSTAVAFTFQAVAQQYVPPANAAIILSAEGLFAALGGALILGERLPPVGYAGAALLFISIVLVETVPALARKPPSEGGVAAG